MPSEKTPATPAAPPPVAPTEAVNACQTAPRTPEDHAAIARIVAAARSQMRAAAAERTRCYAVHHGQAFCGRRDPEALTTEPARVDCTACLEAGPLPTTDAERAEWEKAPPAQVVLTERREAMAEMVRLATERRKALTIALRIAEELEAVPDDPRSLLSVLEACESAAHGAMDEIADLSGDAAPLPAADPLRERLAALESAARRVLGYIDHVDACAYRVACVEYNKGRGPGPDEEDCDCGVYELTALLSSTGKEGDDARSRAATPAQKMEESDA